MAGMVDHKKVLGQLSDLLRQEEDCTVAIYSDPNVVKEKNDLLEIAREKTNEEFRVLIIGAFSSGKSSMINALIGDELLPTGFLPETAVLGELHYGETRKITLYPKKGQWEGGDEPFDLKEATAEEIAKYASLTSDDTLNAMAQDSENRIESKFEKMIVHWPLDILKDGVVLVDSPGINDPYSSDHIVNEYLPRADAIVYVMDAQHAYQKTDVDQLTAINEIGLKNIITGYTFYDVVVKQSRRQPEKLTKVRDMLTSYMAKHSELGPPAIHFLASMDGLDAKIDGDEEKLKSSGYAGFEDYLTKYLVEGKGKDQVKNMATTIIKQADAMEKDAARFNRAAEEDVAALKERAAQATRNLEGVRQNSFNTGKTYKLRLEGYLPKIKTMATDFVGTLADKVDLEDFTPETSLPDGIGKLNPLESKKRAKLISEECQTELQRRMNVRFKQWANAELSEYLKKAVQEATEDIRTSVENISGELTNISDMVAGDIVSHDGNVSNIAVGVVYALLTGDWFTGGMSAVYGKGAMVRGVAFQAAAGVGLGLLMAVGVEVAMPVVALAAIGASVISVITSNNDKKVDKIKSQAVKDLREAYKKPEAQETIDQSVTDIMKNIEAYMANAYTTMQEALAADIKGTEDNIQQMIDEAEMSKDEKETQIRRRNETVASLNEIKQNARGYCEQYGISVI